jgi:hypothetical protein
MRDTTLLSPGPISTSYNLRRIAAASISNIEIVARKTPGGKTRTAKQLQAFFTDCASKLAAYVDSVIPTLAGATATATSATNINIVFLESMDQTKKPLPTEFTIPGDTITAVAWTNATTLALTGTGFAAAETLTYTPGTPNRLTDLAGNVVVGGTKVLV